MDPKIAGKVEFEKLIRPSTFWKKVRLVLPFTKVILSF